MSDQPCPMDRSPNSATEDAESDVDSSDSDSWEEAGAPPRRSIVGARAVRVRDSVPTAQYVKGNVGMARGVVKNKRILRGLRRYGVLVIDISAGGSLSFYANSLLTDAPCLEISDGLQDDSIHTSMSRFVEPCNEPYLHIPASVPWNLQVVGKTSFHIIVPPYMGKVDYRVDLKKFGYMQLKKLRTKNNDLVDHSHDDYNNSSKRNTQLFAFKCKDKGAIAVYAKAAQVLDRNNSHDRRKGIFPSWRNERIRSKQGMKFANQTLLIGRSSSVSNLMEFEDSCGEKEYRCYPLYCYPNTWMTKKDLSVELPRTSKKFHDLRQNSPEEIGYLKFEVLQCIGLPKMDRYSLSDAHCFVVCGSSCFTTDVIPDNCNPAWLPMARRACILPLISAYSQVYVGVFDYDGENASDDFIGRVVIDVSQLPTGRSLSITLPLRRSSRTYSRKPLGSIRLRLKLNWTKGEKAALLSYFPRHLSDVTKRMKSPTNTVTVSCPDAKSFYNVALTVYGKDTPGRYTANMKDAVIREADMIIKILINQTKATVVDVVRWRNPALSLYFFYGWMRFVVTTSGAFLLAFILSLLFLLMMRNYLKYHIYSQTSTLFGHRTIGDMTRTLLFGQYHSKALTPRIRQGKGTNGRIGRLERVLLHIFDIPLIDENARDSWKHQDHAEFPFSTGAVYPKFSTEEAAARPIWEAKRESDAFSDYSSEQESVHDYDSVDSGDEEDDENETPLFKKTSLPDQDVGNIPTSKKQSLGTQIHQFHYKMQRGNLHLFDDRVFISEDRKESIKELKINHANNPVSRRINPMLGDVLKIFEYEVSAFRAVFNILFWKDPMLSYWAMIFICCLMVVVLIFPWQPFFFIVGLLLLGPQNYYLRGWYDSNVSKRQESGTARATLLLKRYHENQSLMPQCQPPESCNASSSLLLRNNMQIKPDGKARMVIVPSAPFRYNRFYDWPPDPDSTTIN